MAGNYNKIVLCGNLTRDPETRHIQSGSSVTKFALAVNRRTKQGDETMFIDIVAWEKLGEICGQYLKKGMSVLIEGRLAIRKYDDKDGVKKTAVEVVANEMQMLGSKRDDSSSNQQTSSSYSGTYGADSHGMGDSDSEDQEIPF
jgi:single-strand DNA-binding protein